MREVGNVGYYITRNYVIYAASGVVRAIMSRRCIWAGQDRNKKCMQNFGAEPSWRLPEDKGIWEGNIKLNHRKIYYENMN
jgi:hypothetical protein